MWITSTFETGRAGSFGGLTGNFDGQGVSFGLMISPGRLAVWSPCSRSSSATTPQASPMCSDPTPALPRNCLSHQARPRIQATVGNLARQMEFARTFSMTLTIRSVSLGAATSPALRSTRLQAHSSESGAQGGRAGPGTRATINLKTERAFAFMFDLVSSHGSGWLNADKFQGRRRALLCHAREEKGRGRAYDAQRDREA